MPAEPQPRADRRQQVPPVEEPGGGEGQVLEHVDAGVLERGVVEGRDVPDPHRADVGDDAERRVRRTARPRARSGGSGAWPGAGCAWSAPSVSRIGARSASSRCWTMCIGELLAEQVDRRDERDEQAARARRTTGRSSPAGRGPRAALGARDAASARRRRRSSRPARAARSGAKVHEVSARIADARRTVTSRRDSCTNTRTIVTIAC